MPRLRLTLLLAAAAAALPAATAAAARSAPVTTTHRDAGVRLQWPAKAARVEVRAGATVRVTVRSLRRRSARVTVTLTRLPGGRVVTRRSLRQGSVALRLPAATGVSYRLTARAGRRLLRRTTLVVPAAPPARAAPPAASSPVPPSLDNDVYLPCWRNWRPQGPPAATSAATRDRSATARR